MVHNLTVEHYHTIIKPILQTSERHECHDFSHVFSRAQRSGIEAEEEKVIIELFDVITSYMLVPDSPIEPFQPMMQDFVNNKRTAVPADLTGEQRDYLQLLLPEIENDELQARIADTLWALKHGDIRKNAEAAIKGYLGSAKNLLSESWHYANERIERAFRIFFAKLGLRSKEVPDHLNVVRVMKDLIATPQNIESSLLAIHLIQLLYETRLEDYNTHVGILEKIAEKEEQNQRGLFHLSLCARMD